MEAFSLMATIALNSKGFESALANAGQGVAGLAKQLVGTQLVLKGVEAGFDAIKRVVQGGIDAYANYEQLVGGVDTLFGEASNQVKRYANEAYKTAGLSANQYMETATSFSASLIQGLKGDTVQAAELANTAIIDMSDNANKMGTDMQSIQNAYMGFAKGNFTMLDNLKLGYGGTKTEMVRLINDSGVLDKKIKSIDEASFSDMIKAIHAVQQELGITGTTASEAADTISGSKSSLLAAFQNLLTFATDGTDQYQLQQAQDAFVKSFAAYFNENLAPKIVGGLKGSTEVFSGIAEALLTVPKGTLGEFLDAAAIGATGLLDALTDITEWLFDQVSDALINPDFQDSAYDLSGAIGEFIGTLVKEGVEHLPQMIGGLFNLGVNIAAGIMNGFVAGLMGSDSVSDELGDITDDMWDAISDADETHMKENALITFIEDLQEKYGEAATEMPEWQEAMQGLIDLGPDWAYFFDSETNGLKDSTQAMRDYSKEKEKMAVEEAKRNALAKKQQLVDDLRTQRAEALGTIEHQEYMQDEINNAMADALNTVLKNNGVAGTFRAGMTAEEYGDIIRNISLATGEDETWANERKRVFMKDAEENGVGFDQLQGVLDYMRNTAGFDLEHVIGENGEEINVEKLNERREKLNDESVKAVADAQKVIDDTTEKLETAEEALEFSRKAIEREYGELYDEDLDTTETGGSNKLPLSGADLTAEYKRPQSMDEAMADFRQWATGKGGSVMNGGYTVEEAKAYMDQQRGSKAVEESVRQMENTQREESSKTQTAMESSKAASDKTQEAVAAMPGAVADAVAGLQFTIKMDGVKVGEVVTPYVADQMNQNAASQAYNGGG